jgi:hypothetical protein
MFSFVKGSSASEKSNEDGSGRMRSAEITDIALAVFTVVLISALLIAFVSVR